MNKKQITDIHIAKKEIKRSIKLVKDDQSQAQSYGICGLRYHPKDRRSSSSSADLRFLHCLVDRHGTKGQGYLQIISPLFFPQAPKRLSTALVSTMMNLLPYKTDDIFS